MLIPCWVGIHHPWHSDTNDIVESQCHEKLKYKNHTHRYVINIISFLMKMNHSCIMEIFGEF